MVHTRWSNRVEYCSAIKRNIYIVLAFTVPFEATRMDLDIVTLSEVSQAEEDSYHMTSLICGIKKKRSRVQCGLVDSKRPLGEGSPPKQD